MVPNLIRVVEELPRTPNGKTSRAELAKLTPTPTGPTQPNHPTNLAVQIASVWSRSLGLTELGPNERFFDIGGHSLLIPGLLREIEDLTGHRLSPRDFFANDTPTDLAVCAMQMPLPQDGFLLNRLTPRRGLPVVSLFQGADGQLRNIVGLWRNLESDFDLVAVNYHSAMSATLGSLADVISAFRAELGTERPVAAIGWSDGSYFAHELARQLVQDGSTLLPVMIDPRPLHEEDLESGLSAESLLGEFGRSFLAAGSLEDPTDARTLSAIAETVNVPLDDLVDCFNTYRYVSDLVSAAMSDTPLNSRTSVLLAEGRDPTSWLGRGADRVSVIAGTDHYSVVSQAGATAVRQILEEGL